MTKNVETALIEQLIEESKYFCGKNCLIDSFLRMDDLLWKSASIVSLWKTRA